MIHRYPNNVIKSKKNFHKPLYKKVKCGKCGHLLHYRGDTSYPFYSCKTARYTDEYGCMHGNVSEKILNEVVMTILLTQIKLFIDNTKSYIIKNKVNKPIILTDNFILQIENEINNLQSNKRKLYEQYKNGEVNHVLYLQEREILEKELSNKITEREILDSQRQNHENVLASAQQLSQTFFEYQSATELTKEMADKFIESVNVYDVDRITIKFTFQDEFEKIQQTVNKS